jgi:streptogramin lyase
VIRLPQGARSGRLRIKTAAGESHNTRLEVYRYEWFDIPPTQDTNAMPLSIARAADGTLWINQEFHYHSRIVCYDPAAPEMNRFRVYNVPGDWNQVIGLVWDTRRNRLWFAEGGLDRGRKIISFDPERVRWDS